MKIKILDDTIEDLKRVEKIVEEYIVLHPELEMQTFSDARELLNSANSRESYNIYLLDIIMPFHNGIDIAKEIRNIEKTAIIIYVTSSPDFALDSYSVSAFHYLLKPVDKQKLLQILEAAVSRIEEEVHLFFLLKTKEGIIKLAYNELEYVEYKGHRIYCYQRNGESVESVTLRESFKTLVAPLLQDSRFIQPHVSYLVNAKYVEKLDNKKLLMEGGAQIPISRSLYAETKIKYMNYWMAGTVIC